MQGRQESAGHRPLRRFERQLRLAQVFLGHENLVLDHLLFLFVRCLHVLLLGDEGRIPNRLGLNHNRFAGEFLDVLLAALFIKRRGIQLEQLLAFLDDAALGNDPDDLRGRTAAAAARLDLALYFHRLGAFDFALFEHHVIVGAQHGRDGERSLPFVTAGAEEEVNNRSDDGRHYHQDSQDEQCR